MKGFSDYFQLYVYHGDRRSTKKNAYGTMVQGALSKDLPLTQDRPSNMRTIIINTEHALVLRNGVLAFPEWLINSEGFSKEMVTSKITDARLLGWWPNNLAGMVKILGIDEASAYKNQTTNYNRSVRMVKGWRTLLITATPITYGIEACKRRGESVR
ncbi:MAG: hypothetical protein M1821_006567 [Bathelium mastoideum]|nr:MAG: hypothetical protein M1821_006567 [Bathelium mastoideum]